MKQLTMLLIVFSANACSKDPIYFGIVNAPNKHVKGYDLAHDYYDDGTLKPTASPTFFPAEKIEDLNKWACTPPESLTLIKSIAASSRARITQLENDLRECQNK